MRNYHNVFVFVMFLTIASSSLGADPHQGKMVNGDRVIPADEIASVKQQALAGSSSASMRLYRFNLYITLDSDQAYFWLSIAAENGDAIGQYALSQELLSEIYAPVQAHLTFGLGTPEGRKSRAIFWLHKARDQGLPEAIKSLKS